MPQLGGSGSTSRGSMVDAAAEHSVVKVGLAGGETERARCAVLPMPGKQGAGTPALLSTSDSRRPRRWGLYPLQEDAWSPVQRPGSRKLGPSSSDLLVDSGTDARYPLQRHSADRSIRARACLPVASSPQPLSRRTADKGAFGCLHGPPHARTAFVFG